jgi:hypothetical protein
MNRHGSTTSLDERREHVRNLHVYLTRHPDTSIRAACREIDPNEPEALRKAYERYRRTEGAAMARITRATLLDHPESFVGELPDAELIRLAQAVLDEATKVSEPTRRQIVRRFALALRPAEGRELAVSILRHMKADQEAARLGPG